MHPRGKETNVTNIEEASVGCFPTLNVMCAPLALLHQHLENGIGLGPESDMTSVIPALVIPRLDYYNKAYVGLPW